MFKIISVWLRQAPYPLAATVLFSQIALGIVLFSIFQEFVPFKLEARDAWTGYLLAIYGGSRFIFEPFAGAISDRVERKLGMILGLILMLTGLALMGLFWNAYAYLAFSGVLGLATAFLWPAIYAISADFYSSSERGKAVGFLNSAQLIGFGFGALLGAFLVNQLPTLLFNNSDLPCLPYWKCNNSVTLAAYLPAFLAICSKSSGKGYKVKLSKCNPVHGDVDLPNVNHFVINSSS